MTFDCMSDDELTLWREGAAMVARRTGHRTLKPCTDCPLWFASEMMEKGCCNGSPRIPARRGSRGPRPIYKNPQERLAARRQTWRDSKRRARARGVQ